MRDFSQKYCNESCPLPSEYSCMWSEIIQSYCKLCERHNKVVTKRKEICQLSQPKHKKFKYRRNCQSPEKNIIGKIEIINKTDKMLNTRTEQLAFPQLRQLKQLKRHPSFSSFNNIRKSGVNRLMRKSIFSVYSRLHNVKPEERPRQTKTWNSENKSKLMKRLRALAEPKKNLVTVESRSSRTENRGEGPKMRRIRKLSKPRVYKEEVHSAEWVLTKALQNYKPSERLLKMAQPKKYEQNFEQIDPIHITQNALTYRATRRIKALAEPAKSKGKREEFTENPFQTNSKALKAIASKRVQELATPKDYMEMHNREDAFRVSRKALRSKLTERLKQLAEPRKR